MRDVERLREKFQISLEDRQVWALGLCALLLLGGVFTLGVLVGRRTSPPQQSTAGDLAALDEAARREKPGPPLAPPSKPGAGIAVASHVPAAPPPPEPQAAPADDAKAAAGSAQDEEAPKPPVGKPDAQKARSGAHASEAARAPVTVSPARAAIVVPPPARPVQVASATPVELTPPPRDVGLFTVQIGASQDRSEALRMENRARAAGLKPYAVEADLGARGTWYRVRVGAFRDKDTANRYRRDVERELSSPAVVMASR